jgi:hypothetical protein
MVAVIVQMSVNHMVMDGCVAMEVNVVVIKNQHIALDAMAINVLHFDLTYLLSN